MCLICIEFDRRRMTVTEARRALGEMRLGLGPAHVKEVEAKLVEAEQPEGADDEQADPPPDQA
jgi:hypothetical protein